MSADLTFRPYHPDDFAVLSEMIFELYADDAATTVGTISTATIQTTIAQFSSDCPMGDIIIFEIRGEVIGYTLLTWFWSNEFGGKMLMIDELLVQSAWRGQGIATVFFQYLFAARKYEEVAYLLEVGAEKQDSARLYYRMGFKTFKTKHLYRLV